jgi:hypothetical protein
VTKQNRMKMRKSSIAWACSVLGLATLGVSAARADASFTMQLVADNDFAVFGGTIDGINDLLYQNGSVREAEPVGP